MIIIEKRRDPWATHFYVGGRRVERGFVTDALCPDGQVRTLTFEFRRRVFEYRGSHNDVDMFTEDSLETDATVMGAPVKVSAEGFAVDPSVVPEPPKEVLPEGWIATGFTTDA